MKQRKLYLFKFNGIPSFKTRQKRVSTRAFLSQANQRSLLKKGDRRVKRAGVEADQIKSLHIEDISAGDFAFHIMISAKIVWKKGETDQETIVSESLNFHYLI